VKGDAFLATNLVVMEPRQPGQGRGNRQGTAGAPGAPVQPQPDATPAGSAPPQQAPNPQN
jgi:hypothetical protein